MKAADLGLIGEALRAATDFERVFPWCEFTDGARDLPTQALRMAKNVVAGGRSWIERTYLPSDASRACQAWVDANPSATSVTAIADGLVRALTGMDDEQLSHLSLHLIRLAFDVRPVPPPRGSMPALWLKSRAISVGGRFLVREGGLWRWHWQTARPQKA